MRCVTSRWGLLEAEPDAKCPTDLLSAAINHLPHTENSSAIALCPRSFPNLPAEVMQSHRSRNRTPAAGGRKLVFGFCTWKSKAPLLMTSMWNACVCGGFWGPRWGPLTPPTSPSHSSLQVLIHGPSHSQVNYHTDDIWAEFRLNPAVQSVTLHQI